MKSIWMKEQKKHYPVLNQDLECDICIIGGGLSGLLCAWQLQKNHHVVLIEADEIGQGASGRNTGKVSSQHGFNYQEILKIHGKAKTKLYYELNQQAIHELHALILQEQLDVDWEVKQSVIGCKSIENTKKVADEMKAYEACEIPYTVIQENEVEGIRYGAMFHEQASFDPYAFCIQLAAKLNIQIYEHTAFEKAEEHRLTAAHHQIHFKHCIFATQVLPFRLPPTYSLTIPLRSYLAAFKPLMQSSIMTLSEEKVIRTESVTRQYHLTGGYEHHVDEADDFKWKAMERMLEHEYPKQKPLAMWRSQDYRSTDRLPMIGYLGDKLIITGFNKWGNTLAYVSSCVIRDHIEGKTTEAAAMFDPQRLSLFFNMPFLSENMRIGKSLIQSKLGQLPFAFPKEKELIVFHQNNHPYGLYQGEN